MARKKRRGGRGFRIGKYVNLVFKGLGLTVAASPAIQGISENLSNPQKIPADVLFRYTGIDETGKFHMDEATKGVVSVIGGLIISKLGGFLARRF